MLAEKANQLQSQFKLTYEVRNSCFSAVYPSLFLFTDATAIGKPSEYKSGRYDVSIVQRILEGTKNSDA